MAELLPKWVYDLLLDLTYQEDTHPELLFTSGAFEGTRKYDWCPCRTLDKVPATVRAQAKFLARYLDVSKTEWPENTSTASAACCELHNRGDDGPCGPEVQGGYCCKACPRLTSDQARTDTASNPGGR